MKRMIFGFFVLISMGLAVSCVNFFSITNPTETGSVEDIPTLLAMGDTSLHNMNYSNAYEAYNKVLVTDPTNSKALEGICTAYLFMKLPISNVINGAMAGDLSVLDIQDLYDVASFVAPKLEKIYLGSADGSINSNDTTLLFNYFIFNSLYTVFYIADLDGDGSMVLDDDDFITFSNRNPINMSSPNGMPLDFYIPAIGITNQLESVVGGLTNDIMGITNEIIEGLSNRLIDDVMGLFTNNERGITNDIKNVTNAIDPLTNEVALLTNSVQTFVDNYLLGTNTLISNIQDQTNAMNVWIDNQTNELTTWVNSNTNALMTWVDAKTNSLYSEINARSNAINATNDAIIARMDALTNKIDNITNNAIVLGNINTNFLQSAWINLQILRDKDEISNEYNSLTNEIDVQTNSFKNEPQNLSNLIYSNYNDITNHVETNVQNIELVVNSNIGLITNFVDSNINDILRQISDFTNNLRLEVSNYLYTNMDSLVSQVNTLLSNIDQLTNRIDLLTNRYEDVKTNEINGVLSNFITNVVPEVIGGYISNILFTNESFDSLITQKSMNAVFMLPDKIGFFNSSLDKSMDVMDKITNSVKSAELKVMITNISVLTESIKSMQEMVANPSSMFTNGGGTNSNNMMGDVIDTILTKANSQMTSDERKNLFVQIFIDLVPSPDEFLRGMDMSSMITSVDIIKMVRDANIDEMLTNEQMDLLKNFTNKNTGIDYIFSKFDLSNQFVMDPIDATSFASNVSFSVNTSNVMGSMSPDTLLSNFIFPEFTLGVHNGMDSGYQTAMDCTTNIGYPAIIILYGISNTDPANFGQHITNIFVTNGYTNIKALHNTLTNYVTNIVIAETATNQIISETARFLTNSMPRLTNEIPDIINSLTNMYNIDDFNWSYLDRYLLPERDFVCDFTYEYLG